MTGTPNTWVVCKDGAYLMTSDGETAFGALCDDTCCFGDQTDAAWFAEQSGGQIVFVDATGTLTA